MLFFDIQKFARAAEDTAFRGRTRLSGNYGVVWINGVKIFEISQFEAKVELERDDVWIGADADSKVTGMKGTGSMTLRKVFSRGLDRYLENQKNGWDERFVLISEIADPDAVGKQIERVRFENLQLDNIPIMNFEKASVIDQQIDFRFTPSDVYYESQIRLNSHEIPHESGGWQ